MDQGDPAGVTLPIEDYAYDGEGNRLASYLSSLYASNDHNQLEEDDTYTYAYDERGNRTSRTDKATGAVETYSYDSQNRLVGYVSDTTTASYAYDAMQRRVAKTVDGNTTAYVYDTSMENPLAHDDITLEFEAGATPFLERRWAHSVAVDEPLGYEQYLSSQDPGTGIERAMYADRQGSILYVTSPVTDTVVAAYEYDGFGAIMQTEGTMLQPYGYTGREFDAESGLYHYRGRSYDPANGMFVQSDPLGFGGGQLGIYGYVSSDPFNLSDPSGFVATYDLVKGSPARQGANTTAATDVSIGAIGLAGYINAALYAALPTAGNFLADGTFVSEPPGYCDQSQYDRLSNAVKLWKAQARACVPIPAGIFTTAQADIMRMDNLRKLQSFSRLALARATLNAVCFPEYYGKNDHRQSVRDALAGMHTCLGHITTPGK